MSRLIRWTPLLVSRSASVCRKKEMSIAIETLNYCILYVKYVPLFHNGYTELIQFFFVFKIMYKWRRLLCLNCFQPWHWIVNRDLSAIRLQEKDMCVFVHSSISQVLSRERCKSSTNAIWHILMHEINKRFKCIFTPAICAKLPFNTVAKFVWISALEVDNRR